MESGKRFDFPALRFSGNSGSSYSSGDETQNNTCVIYTEILIVTTFLFTVKDTTQPLVCVVASAIIPPAV